MKPENIDTVEIEREGGSKPQLVRNGPADSAPGDIVEPYRATADGNTVEAVIAALVKARPIRTRNSLPASPSTASSC